MLPLRDDNPALRPPLLTVALLAANVAAFLWQLLVAGLPASVQLGGLYPAALLGLVPRGELQALPAPVTVLTSMFLHAGFAHVGGNMLFLWIFGNNVEDALGHGRFLAFYLASGAAAALAQLGASLATGDLLVPMVGASGAISGVLAAYLVLYPRARVLTWIPPIWVVHLPAGLFLGLWFLLQLLGILGGGQGGGVAFAAHVGGFLAGLVLILRWRARGRVAAR